MKLFSFAGAIATFVSLATALPTIGKPFGLLAIHSGSPIHNSGLTIGPNGFIQIDPKNHHWVSGEFNSDGTVSVGKNEYLSVSGSGAFAVAAKGSTFRDDGADHLVYPGSGGFFARKDGNGTVYNIVSNIPGTTIEASDISVSLLIFYTES